MNRSRCLLRKKLADEQVRAMTTWIEQGAPWPEGSSEDEVQTTHLVTGSLGVQTCDPEGTTRRPVGLVGSSRRSVHCRRATSRGRSPGCRGGQAALIRRVTFDLIGLPPTPEEIASFLDDPSPGSFARVVERLLASPRYGERWGRHWMDVVRYADTAGDNADYPVPEAARYRDYIIAAFNTDKPFNQFIREQLAGDLVDAAGLARNRRRGDRRHRLPGALAPLWHRALRAVAPDARRRDRDNRAGVPGPDAARAPVATITSSTRSPSVTITRFTEFSPARGSPGPVPRSSLPRDSLG